MLMFCEYTFVCKEYGEPKKDDSVSEKYVHKRDKLKSKQHIAPINCVILQIVYGLFVIGLTMIRLCNEFCVYC